MKLIAELDAWVKQGLITLFDKHFAKNMLMTEPQADDIYLVLCVLSSNNLTQQQTCLLLDQLPASYPFVKQYCELDILANPQALLKHLSKYNHTIAETSDKLFVLEDNRLYLNRFYTYEVNLAAKLQLLAEQKSSAGIDLVADSLQKLFPVTKDIDWQKIAAINSVISQLSIITGGPGTGKTTTVTKILCLLKLLNKDLVINLVAPTGKAANRLRESIRLSKTQLAALHPELTESINLINEEASTIHRLLGISSYRDQLKYHQDNLLPLDVLVVDESSMIDLNTMCKLVAALPDTAKLILIGDPNQLASVEAGCVMSDICSEAISGDSIRFSKTKQELFDKLCGQDVASTMQDSDHFMHNSVCSLKQSYRFGGSSGIGNIAKAINESDINAVKNIINSNYPDLTWLSEQDFEEFLDLCCVKYQKYLELINSDNVESILKAFNEFRVLAATQAGRFGIDAINQAIELKLSAKGLLNLNEGDFYLGRPVLICENDYNLQLFNGDIGLVLFNKDAGKLMVYFQMNDAIKPFLPAQLPKILTCYAMTIHKSQGSEFAAVATILPPHVEINKNLLKRELLYTAVTRAKKEHICLASLETIIHSITTLTFRASGLKKKLYANKPI